MTQFFGRATTDGGRSLSLAGRVAGVSLLCLVLAGGDARAGEKEEETRFLSRFFQDLFEFAHALFFFRRVPPIQE